MATSTVPIRTLSLAHLTLLTTPPPELVSVAAEAGFQAVGLRITPAWAPDQPWYPMLGTSALMRETEQRLADTGLAVLDVEVLRIAPATRATDFEPIFEAAARLRARHALVWCTESDESRARDLFSHICALASGCGMRAVLEFSAFSAVKSLADAARIVRAADQPNAGVLVDALHLSRSGGTPSDVLGLDPGRVFYLQLCDARANAPADVQGLAEESRSFRRFPGEGALPNVELVQAFAPDVPISIEAPCDLSAHLPALEQARLAMRATRKVLASAEQVQPGSAR